MGCETEKSNDIESDSSAALSKPKSPRRWVKVLFWFTWLVALVASCRSPEAIVALPFFHSV